MAAIRWNRNLEIGVPEFDSEHRELFVALSGLRNAVQLGDQVHAGGILDQIGHHATDHFRHEEQSMQRARYSGLNWHRQQHETAKKRLVPLLEDARQDLAGGGERLVAFLAEWLCDHIAVHDRMMAASIRNAERLQRVPRGRRAA